MLVTIFTHIKKKYGQDVRKLVRSIESLMTTYMKVTADIKFIKLCKVEKIIPTFAKVNLSIKSESRKLKLRIARLVMESEIESKHLDKKKLKKELKSICIQLKSVLGLFQHNALLHQVSFAVKSRQKAIFPNSNTIATEFELLFQKLFGDISNISENEVSKIKTQLRNTCKKYSKVKVPCRHRKFVLELSKTENIVILKQGKGRGVVMDKRKI